MNEVDHPGVPEDRDPTSPESVGGPVSDAPAAPPPGDVELVPGEGAPTDEERARNIPTVVYSYNQLRRARELLSRFYGTRRAFRFYPEGHPAANEAVTKLAEIIEQYHSEGVDVVLTFFEDELLLGEQLLPEESVAFDQLIRDMVSIGAGSVVFLRGLTVAELSRSMRVLAGDSAAISKARGIAAAINSTDAEHVRVAAVTVAERAEPVKSGEEREAARETYRVAVELMRDLERTLHSSGHIYAAPVRSVVRTLLDGVLNNKQTMLELSGLKNYHEYTFYHSINVTILSLALGSMITRDTRFLSSLGVAALMHDVGKIMIDVATLNKPGALSSEEWVNVRKHPAFGAEQAAQTTGLDKAAVVVILEHHMREDGFGYPARFPVRRQRLASRLVTVADAYDAMTSKRAYSGARLPDEAVSILARNAGTAFDPAIVRLFVTMMGCYPPRAIVRLSGGETAVVLRPNEGDPTRPVVRVFADATGAVVNPFEVDLLSEAERERSIERCLDPAGLNVDVEDFL